MRTREEQRLIDLTMECMKLTMDELREVAGITMEQRQQDVVACRPAWTREELVLQAMDRILDGTVCKLPVRGQ